MTTVRWLDGVPSTQEVAHWMAEDGAPHGAAVAAREQLAGRGTRGREWYSPIGGLWMSVVCRPRHAVSAACSALRAGLAAAAAVEARVPAATPIALKWPNDLYRDGRKLGGILCEARWQGDRLAWIVVGWESMFETRCPRHSRAAPVGSPKWIAMPTLKRSLVRSLRRSRRRWAPVAR